MKVVKKIFKVIFTLIALALLAGAGYVMYDYYQNPEDYDEIAQAFQDKATGKDKIVVEEVSPFITPEMTLSLDGTPYEGMPFLYHPDFHPEDPIILCYGKDKGGDLYTLYVDENLPQYSFQQALLYSGPGVPEQDITEYVVLNAEYDRIEIREELLMSLDAGEYYIVTDFLDEENDFLHRMLIAIIMEEEITFNSTQRGFLTYGDEFAWIVNDLDNPKEISFSFYNLGDNPIRKMVLVSENAGAYLTTDMEPDQYYINERGDTVTLTVDYLQTLQVNTCKKLGVRLANGDVLDMGWTVLGTVRGDSLQRLTITGPDTYSLSAGGDYVATFELNQCERLYSNRLTHYSSWAPGVDIYYELVDGRNNCVYLDLETQTITIPEEVMQTIPPNDGNVQLDILYVINGMWLDTIQRIIVTE